MGRLSVCLLREEDADSDSSSVISISGLAFCASFTGVEIAAVACEVVVSAVELPEWFLFASFYSS